MSSEQWAVGLRRTNDLRQMTTEGFASPTTDMRQRVGLRYATPDKGQQTTDNKVWLPELRKHGSTAEQKKEFVYVVEKL